MTHDALVAVGGAQGGVGCQKLLDLSLDGLGQQFTGTRAQYLGQWIID